MSAQKEIYALFWVFVLASTLVVVFCGLYLIFFRMNELLRNLSRSLYIQKNQVDGRCRGRRRRDYLRWNNQMRSEQETNFLLVAGGGIFCWVRYFSLGKYIWFSFERMRCLGRCTAQAD